MNINSPIASPSLKSLLNTKGDIIKHDGAAAKKYPVGSAFYVLSATAAGDDIEYVNYRLFPRYMTVKGDIAIRGDAVCERLAIGTVGQILRVNIAEDALEYQDPDPLTCRIKTGTYVGDGTTSQVIDTGVATQLKAVLVMRYGALATPSGFLRLDNCYEDTCLVIGDGTVESNRIIALGVGTFTVDDDDADSEPNSNAATYTYIVWY